MENRLGVFANINYSKFETTTDLSTAADVGQCRAVPQRRFRSIAGQDLYLRSEHRRSDRDGRKFPCFWSRRRAGLFVAVAHRHSDKVGCSRVSGGLPRGVSGPDDGAKTLNAIPAGDNVLGTVSASAETAAHNRTAAQLEQTNGLQTCLNQWNDYAPSLIRSLPQKPRSKGTRPNFVWIFG